MDIAKKGSKWVFSRLLVIGVLIEPKSTSATDYPVITVSFIWAASAARDISPYKLGTRTVGDVIILTNHPKKFTKNSMLEDVARHLLVTHSMETFNSYDILAKNHIRYGKLLNIINFGGYMQSKASI